LEQNAVVDEESREQATVDVPRVRAMATTAMPRIRSQVLIVTR
jgi:hypothetical protein